LGSRRGSLAHSCSRAPWARDLALGLGGLRALTRNDSSARTGLAAAAVCDAVDFGATWTAGRGIPRQARSGVLAIAGVFSLLSAIAAVGIGGSGHAEARLSGPHDVTKGGAVPREPAPEAGARA
jgi:hypothetical protein